MQDEINSLGRFFSDQMNVKEQSHFEALSSLVGLTNKKVVDVGCGFGELAQQISQRALEVIGIDCSNIIVEQLLDQPNRPRLTFKYGKGENLPIQDQSVDLVVYTNSFHHVEPLNWDRALLEAVRVLKNDRSLFYVAEPIPAGDYFSVTKIVDDEALIREEAFQKLISQKLFRIEQTAFYFSPKTFCSFEEFELKSTAISSKRAKKFEIYRETIKEAFSRLGQRGLDNKIHFKQPMRVVLMSQIVKNNM